MDAALVDTMTGDVTYLVYPTTYMHKLKGVPMREAARMAMVLHKEGAAWRFVSWTWTGTVPKVAAKEQSAAMLCNLMASRDAPARPRSAPLGNVTARPSCRRLNSPGWA